MKPLEREALIQALTDIEKLAAKIAERDGDLALINAAQKLRDARADVESIA